MEISDNRTLLSILFGLSGIVFFLLFLDSHYQNLINSKNELMKHANVGKAVVGSFGNILKKNKHLKK